MHAIISIFLSLTGRLIEGHWILGLIEIQTGPEGEKRRGGRFRLEILPDNSKTEATLVSFIEKHVEKGTTIVTDSFKSYHNLRRHNYNHFTVNHSENFRDPLTGANTQTIESNWRPLKRKLLRGGFKDDTLADHLCEYLWRREILMTEEDPFIAFVKAAAHTYNPLHSTAVYRG